MTRFQKLATAALISLLVLMFVGATVRVTGAGMGCPDWPTCWGCLIPPTRLDQVDFDKLPIEKFRKKAERLGRDPAEITVENLRKEFNPRHVWTEFLNRLTSIPVGILTLAMFIASFWERPKRPLVFWVSFASVIIVFINAWMGARIVYSGLKPGVITTHLALAMGLIGLLVYSAWRGTEKPWRIIVRNQKLSQLRLATGLILFATITQGIMGSQVREMTDELSKLHLSTPRETWIHELEQSWIYLIHRSFSWLTLAACLWAWFLTKRYREGGVSWLENSVIAIMFTQMLLGVVMAQVHIYSWSQVLHVGLAAVMLALVCLWICGLSRSRNKFSNS